jgi:ribosomal protein L37AE/L43A
MAGCFGNHPFDRAMEQQLDRHLDELDKLEEEHECPYCGYLGTVGEFDDNNWVCPECEDINCTPEDEEYAALEDKYDNERKDRILFGD